MSKTLLIIGAVAALSSMLIFSQKPQATMTVAEDISSDVPFLDYITEFGKHYVDHVEFKARYSNFMNTHKIILEHNAKEASFFLGHNQFSDWSDEEYTNFLTYRQDESKKSLEMFTPSKPQKDSPIDWRK